MSKPKSKTKNLLLFSLKINHFLNLIMSLPKLSFNITYSMFKNEKTQFKLKLRGHFKDYILG